MPEGASLICSFYSYISSPGFTCTLSQGVAPANQTKEIGEGVPEFADPFWPENPLEKKMPEKSLRKSCDVGLRCEKSGCFLRSSDAKCLRFGLPLRFGLRCERPRCQIASDVGRAMRTTKTKANDRNHPGFSLPAEPLKSKSKHQFWQGNAQT